MTFPLRLPSDLHELLVREADRLQVSRNALVTIALDSFLRGGGVVARSVAGQPDQAVGVLSGCSLSTPPPIVENAPELVPVPLLRDGGAEPVTEDQASAIYAHGRAVGIEKLNRWQQRVYRAYRAHLDKLRALERR